MSTDAAIGFHEESERLRLEACVREPIRTPGRIQSYGALLALDAATGVIEIASENAVEWLGRRASDLQSESLNWAIAHGSSVDPPRVTLAGAPYDANVYRAEGRVVVEFEPVADAPEFARTGAVGAIQRLLSIDDIDELIGAAADEVRRISGYDRVLVYRFYDDEHGEVVGESADPALGLEPYLGLHFPASDIPLQARALYVTKTSRSIASTSLDTWNLVALDPEAPPLDLGPSELRAVSPHHLEFMRNMGQESTISLSLVDEGRLIGMVTCAHGTSRRAPILMRRALEVLAVTLTRQIVSRRQIASLERSLRASARRAALLAPLAASGDVLATLLDESITVLDLVEADGVIVRVGGTVRSSGSVPPGDSGSLLNAIGPEALVTANVGEHRPDLVPALPGFAGVLALPLGDGNDAIVFLRREVAQVVRWLGDLSASNRDTPLSPRRSFSEWKQSVSGTAIPWLDAVEEATDLARELSEAVARRADAELAHLALIDPLTGLYNRRHLVERVREDAVVRRPGVLLFLDLDLFKSVNDRHGHAAGDVVLRTVAERLRAQSRADDLVARLGGDEFVVYCSGADESAAVELGERLIAAIAQDIVVGEQVLRITASCGVAAREDGLALIAAADAAMYRAKNEGRGRVAR